MLAGNVPAELTHISVIVETFETSYVNPNQKIDTQPCTQQESIIVPTERISQLQFFRECAWNVHYVQ